MTTPPPDPGHAGLRPLSPYGEGYCRVCHFVVGLTYDGKLVGHTRGALLMNAAECKGSGARPPSVTPYGSRKAAFRLSSPDCWCPECKQTVATTRQGGMHVYARHSYRRMSAVAIPKMCVFTNRAVAPAGRDHGNERG